jgi:hypothetical protein
MSILNPEVGILPENKTSLSIKIVKKVSVMASDPGEIINSCNSIPEGIVAV